MISKYKVIFTRHTSKDQFLVTGTFTYYVKRLDLRDTLLCENSSVGRSSLPALRNAMQKKIELYFL